MGSCLLGRDRVFVARYQPNDEWEKFLCMRRQQCRVAIHQDAEYLECVELHAVADVSESTADVYHYRREMGADVVRRYGGKYVGE